MTDPCAYLPTRHLLNGELVNWSEEEVKMEDHSGLTLAWKDLCVWRIKSHSRGFWRSARYEEVKVLDRVSGLVTQGNLIAIMGPSGAGKTSLLAAISRRDRTHISGSLLLNGCPAGDLLPRISGFVPQHDLTLDELNVAEHMTFMARMMMDRGADSGTRMGRIQQLLTELNVNGCMYTKLNALSGGERKRISLAVQLLNDPPILFCDEPTTGLDSHAANAVVSRLQRLTTAGKLVICSIHQPASGVFEMFDQVFFLSEGRVAFQGSIDKAAKFFCGIGLKCPLGFNQAEYYVGQLCVAGGQELKGGARVRRICDEFRRSDLASQLANMLRLQAKYGDFGDRETDRFERFLTLKKVGPCVQFGWLMWRSWAELRRNHFIWIIEMVVFMLTSLLLAIPYAGSLSPLDYRGIQNAEGLMYLSVAETIFTFIYCVYMAFPREISCFLRESADGLYTPMPYYLSKMIFWIPRAIVFPTIYAMLIYFVVGLPGGAWFCFWFSFMAVLSAMAATAYGSFLSATFTRLETAAIVSVPADLIGLMFSGIYLNLDSVSPYFAWLKYISMFHYGTEAVSILLWQNVTEIDCEHATGRPCMKTGLEVLAHYGYRKENFWIDVAGLCGMYGVLNVVAHLMVVRRSRHAAVY